MSKDLPCLQEGTELTEIRGRISAFVGIRALSILAYDTPFPGLENRGKPKQT